MKEMKDFKFIIIILLTFFGVGIMAEIEDYDYNVNNTGIMYQENDNIVLNENNRYYDYDIDYNLTESYLHYNPVKKGGLLYNYESKNLASPNLEDKEYLGNYVYRLYDNNNMTLDYNFNDSVYTLNGTIDSGENVRIPIGYIENWEQGVSYTSTFNVISTNSFFGDRIFESFHINTGGIYAPYWVQNLINVIDGGLKTTVFSNQNNATFNLRLTKAKLHSVITFNDWQFTLQIEKGDTSTSYQVPYIPAFKIDFKGTNQVEYINPYEEQIIEIDDINNVNNIEFELLNVVNPVVYNWNITTNPNMPFVRFYNNQTKLLYDFTDVREMNFIGNRLMISQSGIFPVIKNALDTVDIFYKGFQQLFNKERVNSIVDWLKVGWPKLPPILPILWR